MPQQVVATAVTNCIFSLGGAPSTFVPTPRMVRGLDYYTRTTFEFVHGSLGAQNSVLGGGRYDGLAEALGGPRSPGIGFSVGVLGGVHTQNSCELAPAAFAVKEIRVARTVLRRHAKA